MNARYTRITAARCRVSLCCVVALSGGGESPASGARDEVIVALVNRKVIPYSAIEVTPEAARSRFAYEHERDPVTDPDFEQVEGIRQRFEAKRLVNFIRATIREQQIERLGIECSDAEVKARWERLLEEQDPPAKRAAARAQAENLLECLRAVYEGAADPDVVYDTQLTYRVTRKQWKAVLHQYRAPETRRLLEELLNKDVHEFDDDAKETARTVLAMEKLIQAVEDDLIRADPEFAEYVRLLETDPRNKKLKSRGPRYRDARRYEWWQARYREADVEIKDERFKDVWKQPFE